MVKWIGYIDRHNSWVVEEDLHANHLVEQFQASRSSATTFREFQKGIKKKRNYFQRTVAPIYAQTCFVPPTLKMTTFSISLVLEKVDFINTG